MTWPTALALSTMSDTRPAPFSCPSCAAGARAALLAGRLDRLLPAAALADALPAVSAGAGVGPGHGALLSHCASPSGDRQMPAASVSPAVDRRGARSLPGRRTIMKGRCIPEGCLDPLEVARLGGSCSLRTDDADRVGNERIHRAAETKKAPIVLRTPTKELHPPSDCWIVADDRKPRAAVQPCGSRVNLPPVA
jgi:hypothetical protein